ncbi:NADPH-dependent ferric siderophore reductase, contains FAD-binding and SIP domains [Leifsonia sp. 98AMF]|uniref:siderophore-interacting protein n=1 Tax=unclassified Leifsonia TaxID=2663824 RepID=UPI00087DB7E0|nr:MULTISPECIES: siderophore-interacting protein [unclassified Leifsonia]SDH69818.1 NADPH-dependent ferric siderophore reductase, contains FAD-binding and SIP domains [Leifsonia sp. 197AMF]SDI70071.1 NADPH-dependent ferric siderophore reductase, contains FAD-binding and SIP domains [Leifsonia sp. 466MF]SDK20953.1 NADPH-dependent ferric siderophore reductase, contains FAD-binding and SIP domains [Leifsonia sp. 157MF]SDN72466.1 NADPH-dependent ferric siderophore reductase, contains FAD-binding an
MARTNMQATRVKPERSELLVLHVLRRERISSGFVRVTLGGGDIERFVPLGYDQWFRLFIPVGDDSTLDRLPTKLDTLAYARYLAISKAVRPVLRNYTVRAFRPDGPEGPELDVDFVLHRAADGSSGPAASWAEGCARGDAVAIIDEGRTFAPAAEIAHLRIVADETGLPAVAGILASLAERSSVSPGLEGTAVIEVPNPDDVQELIAPAGMDVRWAVRGERGGVPGALAADAARSLAVPAVRSYGWAVGESELAVGMRRHWLSTGTAKADIVFCGYWKSRH